MKALTKFENLDYDTLRGIDKAAILVNYLGQDAIKVLFNKMDDGDIRKLIHLMTKFKIVPVHITKRVLEEFYETLSESEDFIFSDKIASKETIITALGEERARGIMGGLNISGSSGRTLESLEMVDANSKKKQHWQKPLFQVFFDTSIRKMDDPIFPKRHHFVKDPGTHLNHNTHQNQSPSCINQSAYFHF